MKNIKNFKKFIIKNSTLFDQLQRKTNFKCEKIREQILITFWSTMKAIKIVFVLAEKKLSATLKIMVMIFVCDEKIFYNRRR